MGGTGSGGWYRWRKKDTVEEHHSIDVRKLHREGSLRPGLLYSLSWTRGGEPAGSVQVQSWGGAITLIYRHRRHGQEWEDVRQDVPLDWTPCHFGGERPWFICGNCGRRVAVLYGAGKYFACRHCYELTYRSCQESDSRFNRFLRNYENFSRGWENMPIWILKGFLDRELKEEKRMEKEMNRRRRGRPRKVGSDHNKNRGGGPHGNRPSIWP
jgi:hypothetical protein